MDIEYFARCQEAGQTIHPKIALITLLDVLHGRKNFDFKTDVYFENPSYREDSYWEYVY